MQYIMLIQIQESTLLSGYRFRGVKLLFFWNRHGVCCFRKEKETVVKEKHAEIEHTNSTYNTGVIQMLQLVHEVRHEMLAYGFDTNATGMKMPMQTRHKFRYSTSVWQQYTR